MAAEVAVLSFHKIGEPPSGGWTTWNYIPTATFTGFLEELARRGYEVLDWPAFRVGLEDAARLPARAALLTFDDGYRSMLTVALPLLERFGHPAVLFVPAGHVGGRNAWDAGQEPDEPLCTFAELRELQARGVSVQSHGVTHRAFSTLDATELAGEIGASKRRLEAGIDAAVDALAFPYGDAGKDPAAMEAAMRDAGYKAAFLYKGGVTKLPATDPFRIHRVPMGPDTDLARWLT